MECMDRIHHLHGKGVSLRDSSFIVYGTLLEELCRVAAFHRFARSGAESLPTNTVSASQH
jgi:hypothetical protein